MADPELLPWAGPESARRVSAQQRYEAIQGERTQARTELQAEGQRLERLVDEVRREVDRLRELTTDGG